MLALAYKSLPDMPVSVLLSTEDLHLNTDRIVENSCFLWRRLFWLWLEAFVTGTGWLSRSMIWQDCIGYLLVSQNLVYHNMCRLVKLGVLNAKLWKAD